MDWQLISPEQLDAFLDGTMLPALTRLMETPLEALGKEPFLWNNCMCKRDKCEACWVEKNLWEAKE